MAKTWLLMEKEASRQEKQQLSRRGFWGSAHVNNETLSW